MRTLSVWNGMLDPKESVLSFQLMRSMSALIRRGSAGRHEGTLVAG